MLTLTIGKQNNKSLPKRKRPLENHTNETKLRCDLKYGG